jgi:hypothetical protein
MAVCESAQIATSTARNFIASPFAANPTDDEMLYPGQQRLWRYNNEFAGFIEAKCTYLRVLSISDFDAKTCMQRQRARFGHRQPGEATGGFIPRSRDTHKVGA